MVAPLTGTADRVRTLLDEPSAATAHPDGYLDLLDPSTEPPPTLAQSVMRSTFLPQVYERVWRPVGFNLAKGWPLGPDTGAEHALARGWLGLGRPGADDRPDATVLDVACGPGNVTRALAAGVGKGGLVVGLDAAAGMLGRAVGDTADPVDGPDVGYVRGDAVDLPFRDATFDAVCCLGALYLFDDPWAAVDSMLRVLRPGGRITILTSRRPRPPLLGAGTTLGARSVGIRMFGDRDVVRALDERGCADVRQRRFPLMQIVGARRPADAP